MRKVSVIFNCRRAHKNIQVYELVRAHTSSKKVGADLLMPTGVNYLAFVLPMLSFIIGSDCPSCFYRFLKIILPIVGEGGGSGCTRTNALDDLATNSEPWASQLFDLPCNVSNSLDPDRWTR